MEKVSLRSEIASWAAIKTSEQGFLKTPHTSYPCLPEREQEYVRRGKLVYGFSAVMCARSGGKNYFWCVYVFHFFVHNTKKRQKGLQVSERGSGGLCNRFLAFLSLLCLFEPIIFSDWRRNMKWKSTGIMKYIQTLSLPLSGSDRTCVVMILPRRGFLHVFFAAAPETFTYEREKMFFSLTKDERRASSSQPAVSTIRGL